jgi:hypothetical protein
MFQIKRTQLLVAAALAASSASVLAVEFSIEGKLTELYDAAGKAGAIGEAVATVDCNGSRITLKNVDPGKTVYSTPSTSSVNKAAFFSATKLPGYGNGTEAALKNGTCIIEGNSNGATLLADTFFAEPAENVLVGPVTSGPTEQFAIMGVPIVLLTDDTTHLQDPTRALAGALNPDPNKGMPDPEKRIVASPPANQFGYPVVLSSVPKDDLSAAEGYLAGGTFYAFSIETTGGNPRTPDPAEPATGLPAPTVQRGTLEFRSTTASRLEIRGGCAIGDATTLGVSGTAPNRTQAIRVVVDSTNIPVGSTTPVTRWFMPNNVAVNQSDLGTIDKIPDNAATNATCTEDAATPGSGSYRFRVDSYTYGGNTGRAVPVNVKVGIRGKSYSVPSVMERVKFP